MEIYFPYAQSHHKRIGPTRRHSEELVQPTGLFITSLSVGLSVVVVLHARHIHTIPSTNPIEEGIPRSIETRQMSPIFIINPISAFRARARRPLRTPFLDHDDNDTKANSDPANPFPTKLYIYRSWIEAWTTHHRRPKDDDRWCVHCRAFWRICFRLRVFAWMVKWR